MTEREPALPKGAFAVVVVLLVAYGAAPLAAMLAHASSADLVFAGADGPFPADQHQYFAWIREFEQDWLAANTLDTAESGHVFLHPMFLVSGIGVRLGIGIELAYQLWKPVAIAALLVGFLAYVNRFVEGRWARLAALTLGLLYSGAALGRFVLDGLDLDGDHRNLLGAGGEMLAAGLTTGYVPAAVSVALMPLFLLGIERIDRAIAAGASPSLALVAATSGAGAASAWLHPWQGEVLLVTAGAALALALMARRRWRRGDTLLLLPLAATLAPLVYYFVLSRVDPAWEFAAQANERVGQLPLWALLVALAPLAVPAALGVRDPGAGLGERMLLIWPLATLLAFFALSPSFPLHALEGISLPLAVLAVRWLATVPRPALAGAALCALLVIPGLSDLVDSVQSSDERGTTQVRYLEPGEADALDYLRDAGAPGPVLTRSYLGALVPGATGRASWVGHPSWTRDYVARALQTEDLFAGDVEPARAEAMVHATGAAFLLVDCRRPDAALAALRRLAVEERRFGCAAVLRVGPA